MGSALFPDQRQRKSPKVPGTPVILGSFLIALLCGTLPAPHGPGGTPLRPRSAQPPERRRCPRQLEGNPWLLLVAPESSASGPGDGSGGAGGGLGLWEGASPSAGLEGGRALTCSWIRASRGAWAAGRRGTAPRHPGSAAPAPSARARGAGVLSEATFCARRAPSLRNPKRGGSGRERKAAGSRGAAGEGWKLGRFAGPHRATRPPPPASRSHFSFSTPCALASLRSLNDAQVPPGCRPLYFTSLSET